MSPRLWLVVPAAGVGVRVAAQTPKQYLPLAGRTVIEWALAPFLAHPSIDGVVVALAPGDKVFNTLPRVCDARVRCVTGGAERADSVLRGLDALQANAQATGDVGENAKENAKENAREDDWVLVHDAARPCLHMDDVERLLTELKQEEVGGLLAVPLADTLKSSDSTERVLMTPPREHLWRALTPQMFRFGLLRRALQSAAAAGIKVTDESAAMERLGYRPRLIRGRADNIKITLPEDLLEAEFILRHRVRQ